MFKTFMKLIFLSLPSHPVMGCSKLLGFVDGESYCNGNVEELVLGLLQESLDCAGSKITNLRSLRGQGQSRRVLYDCGSCEAECNQVNAPFWCVDLKTPRQRPHGTLRVDDDDLMVLLLFSGCAGKCVSWCPFYCRRRNRGLIIKDAAAPSIESNKHSSSSIDKIDNHSMKDSLEQGTIPTKGGDFWSNHSNHRVLSSAEIDWQTEYGLVKLGSAMDVCKPTSSETTIGSLCIENFFFVASPDCKFST